MRWSQFFIPTLKEAPKDATAASHVLMLRSGLVRQVAAGVYGYLPLGLRVLRKVEQIIREEMNRAGAIELRMSVMMPLAWWDENGTNRAAAYGDVLYRLHGPDESDYRRQTVLGPTHEEQITEIARAYLSSYKQLPVNLYQIQLKFRGEARPKSGILRTREFLMKDAYSFHADVESLNDGYQKMYDAYCRIFARCGLPYVAVEAESGPIGGDASHEFMVLTDAGEDIVAISENGDYAANTERATCEGPRGGVQGSGVGGEDSAKVADGVAQGSALREVHTPGAGKVDEVCKVLGIAPAQMIKTLIYVSQPATAPAADVAKSKAAGSGKAEAKPKLVVALVRGHHEVNEHKLAKVAGLKLEMADVRTIEELTGAAVGFAGPQGLVEKLDMLIVDRDVATMRDAATGANKTDYHVTGLIPGRDFPLETPAGGRCQIRLADIRTVVEGDLSPTGSGSPIRLKTAIEVGHVFKLGTKYSDALGAKFLNKEGRPHSLIMGCYGIGVNRIVAAAIEAHHDVGGIQWPLSIAPFSAIVISLDPKDEQVTRVATEIHDQLEAGGVDVLLDDRDERAGFKFKDADLIGVPLRIVVGKKSLADGVVEFSRREKPEEKQLLSPEKAVEALRNAVQSGN